MTWTNQKLSGRIPELDGIRGLAILLVLVLHYVVELGIPCVTRNWQFRTLLLFRLSWSGVDLFFVLSGFLIGGILLDAKYADNYYRTFYLRRFYRIVPLYALLILILVAGTLCVNHTAKPLTALFNWRIPFLAYAMFMQNVSMTLHGTYGCSWMGVTWSLAVEEQFYLLLPFVIRRLSHKGIMSFAIGMIVTAPVLRTILGHYGANGLAIYTLLPCRADALGCGLLVAIACRNQTVWTWLASHRRYVYAAFAVFGSGILIWILGDVSFGYTWMAGFYTSLLILAVVSPGRMERSIFRSFVLMRLGTVAYALYLFHPGILRLYHFFFFGKLPSIHDFPTFWVTLLSLCTVVLFAELSWMIFEKPLIRFARIRFQYVFAGHSTKALFFQPILADEDNPAPAAGKAVSPGAAAETEPVFAEDSPYSTTSTRVTISSRGRSAGQ